MVCVTDKRIVSFYFPTIMKLYGTSTLLMFFGWIVSLTATVLYSIFARLTEIWWLPLVGGVYPIFWLAWLWLGQVILRRITQSKIKYWPSDPPGAVKDVDIPIENIERIEFHEQTVPPSILKSRDVRIFVNDGRHTGFFLNRAEYEDAQNIVELLTPRFPSLKVIRNGQQ